MIRTLTVAAAVMAASGPLSGCARVQSSLVGQVAARAVPALAPDVTPDQAAAAAAASGFGPADVVANPQAFQLVQVPGLGIAGLAREVADSGGRQTWIGDSGYSVTFENGLLVATRGFGKDLMAADVTGVRAALIAGGGTATRAHDYLDSRDRVVTSRFDCTLAPTGVETVDLGVRQVETVVLTETCTGERVGFQNLYYVDETGEIVATRQFVSDIVAYLRNNIL